MNSLKPLERAFELIQKKYFDALLITSRENTRYLSGFTGSESTALIVPDDGGLFLFVDSRYTEQAKQQCPGWHIVEYKRSVETVSKKIVDLKLKVVGFESRYVSYNLYNLYVELLKRTTLVPIERMIDQLRATKLFFEINAIKQAVKIAETAFQNNIESLMPGITEIEWALHLENAIRRQGSGLLPFEIIVASGERGAMPHAQAASKPIKKGDFVTIDFGASFEGYCSDTTHTVAVGKPDKELAAIYEIVLDAHDAAIEAVKPGMQLKDLDAVARKHIDRKGYGKYFGHGLGHGVGLAVHEEPHVSPLGEGIVEEGQVFTIEPGIYVPGLGGVRIEDMVYVAASGAELLTALPKKLRII